jgi:hypothetical protein
MQFSLPMCQTDCRQLVEMRCERGEIEPECCPSLSLFQVSASIALLPG